MLRRRGGRAASCFSLFYYLLQQDFRPKQKIFDPTVFEIDLRLLAGLGSYCVCDIVNRCV